MLVLWYAVMLAAPAAAGVPAGRSVDFATEVVPILTRAGCNSGTCHGAAIGRGGFRLSLLGSEPEVDFDRITRERGGRRVQSGAPDSSLVLMKASGVVAHGGGVRLRRDSGDYRVLRDWVASGAGSGGYRKALAELTITPEEAWLPKPGASTPIRVMARFSDGEVRDVTRLALLSTNDDSVAEVGDGGVITARRPGVTSVMVRFLGEVGSVRVASPFGPALPKPAPADNPVDRVLFPELARLGLPASAPVDDAGFLRRLHLDALGTLPSAKEVRAALVDRRPDRRRRWIEAALARPEFITCWTGRFASLLGIEPARQGSFAAAYHGWLRSRLANNGSLEELVIALVRARETEPPSGFYRAEADPRDLGESFSRSLLGIRLECARCHNHPYDRWSQTDYHAFAALFARVRRDGDRIITASVGEVEHPRTRHPVPPRALGMPESFDTPTDRRELLTVWLKGPGRPLLARSLVNRIWRHLMGRGLVEPVDDLRQGNPPLHPRLLQELTSTCLQSDFNLRSLVRAIVSSRAYGLESRAVPGNRADQQLFSHYLTRPLSGAVLADALARATGVPDLFPGQPAGTTAQSLVDPRTPSEPLDALGRCRRGDACDAAPAGPGLRGALYLLNNAVLQEKLSTGIVASLANSPLEAAVEELTLRTLSRLPSPEERDRWRKFLAGRSDRKEALEDLLWALINSREFAFNH